MLQNNHFLCISPNRKKQEELQKKQEEERKEQERIEKEQKEKERKEKERLEAERLEAERLEKERIEKEQERLEKEKLEKEQKTQEILAKIAAEKGIKTTEKDEEVSKDMKSQDKGDDCMLHASSEESKSEPPSGDLSMKGHVQSPDNILKKNDSNSEVGNMQLSAEKDKPEYSKLNHVDQSKLEGVPNKNHPSTSGSSTSSLPSNQMQNFDTNNKSVDETKLDRNDKLKINNNASSEEKVGIMGDNLDDTYAQSQSSTGASVEASSSIQEHHNSNNHASTERTFANTVMDSVGFSKPDVEMAPSIGDVMGSSASDSCIAAGALLEPLPEDVEKMRLQWMEKSTSLRLL